MKAEYVDHMGSDLTVVNSARVSFDKHHSVFGSDDSKLLQYLAKNGHWSPFAHPQIQLRLTAPVAIRTQCFKHKIGFVENEVSRRYVSDDPLFYVPDVWRAAPTGGAKQGSSGIVDHQGFWQGEYEDFLHKAFTLYREMVAAGVAPEQVRFILPQSMLTQWYWTGSLMAYANFYKLRSDAHAQMEIQELAKQVDTIIRPLYPESWSVLCDPKVVLT